LVKEELSRTSGSTGASVDDLSPHIGGGLVQSRVGTLMVAAQAIVLIALTIFTRGATFIASLIGYLVESIGALLETGG
jgi:hypothetical protein